MLLDELEIKNFKSVKEVKIKLSKLNLFIGKNNSGKSTILQVLLFLKQCGNSIQFSNPFDFGTFELLKHKNTDEKEIQIRSHWKSTKKPQNKTVLDFSLFPTLDNLVIFETFTNKSHNLSRIRLQASTEDIYQRIRDILRLEIRPNTIPGSFPHTELWFKPKVQWRGSSSSSSGNGLLNWSYSWKQISNPTPIEYETYKMLLSFTKAQKKLQDSFKNILPIFEPRFIHGLEFKLSQKTPTPENAFEFDEKGTLISNILTLKDAISLESRNKLVKWARKFGLTDIKTEILEYYNLTLFTEELNDRLPVALMGSGSRQALVLIGIALLSKPKCMLLIEEPEHSLHPEYQAIMMDFFIDQISSGKQLLITTHSEHLLTRLQRRIAEEAIDIKDIKVFWVNKKEKETNIEEVKLDEDGIFPDGLRNYLDFIQNEIKAINIARETKSEKE